MIRIDKDHQWASTQMAIHDEPYSRETPDDTMLPRKRAATPAKWPLEDRSSDQGRGIEAAHAAIDWDDDKRPIPGSGPVLWLVWGVVTVLGVLVALPFFARMGWL
jgi:hypothetical protein